jgi:hypothetical protein
MRRRERESEGEGGEKDASGPGRACSSLQADQPIRGVGEGKFTVSLFPSPARRRPPRDACPSRQHAGRSPRTHALGKETPGASALRCTARRSHCLRALPRVSRPRPIYRTAGLDVLSLRFSPVSLVRTCVGLDMLGGANTDAADRDLASADEDVVDR